ncbi:2,3-butanediol dehydrogenase [Rhodococcus sp. X156]|uniref:2,3-butanediol dehydrogenase n=1 Tax=Rhodococcus sp. X156 TaxID=2499145 RepID=UPI000FDB6756|nr:2,3-butanediol dehydrogenase [Rhodococcus sp. X156]
MRALVLHGADDLRLEDLEPPVPGAGEVLVRVAFNGICGSDLSVVDKGFLASEPHPLTGAHGPQVLGHEFSGTVEQLGTGVTQLQVGDRVAVQPNYSCGTCPRCRDGLAHLCAVIAFHGLSAHGGGLSELTVVPARNAHPLPESVSLRQGAVVEPLAVALHGVRLAEPSADELALVLGGGPIGICAALNLRVAGVQRILLSEPSPQRRAVLQSLGLEVLDPTSTDVRAEVLERSDGAGADLVLECAGAPAAIDTALSSVRARGRVVLLATYPQPVELYTYALMFSEAQLRCSMVYSAEEFREVIALMAQGSYDLDGWVQQVPMVEAVTEGFQAASAGRAMKVLVEVGHG